MQGHLITAHGPSDDLSPAAIERLLQEGAFFWLDLYGLDDETVTLLRDVFRLHELAIEDADHFGQRAKLDTYDDYVVLVVFGALPTERFIEVHCVFAERYLVTLHREDCPTLNELGARLEGRLPDRPVLLLHRVVDALVDSFFPVLARFDDDIDQLEDAILDQPRKEQLERLFDMKRSLIHARKAITPQRDVFATVLGGVDSLPGMDREAERYFRDIYDHLIRISEMVDGYRDLLSGAMDTYLSMVSNRLNSVMKQLTIIATVFLPLSFLTGFFGQNFGWLIDHISGLPEFAILGIGIEVVTVVGLMLLFKHYGWLSADPTESTGRK